MQASRLPRRDLRVRLRLAVHQVGGQPRRRTDGPVAGLGFGGCAERSGEVRSRVVGPGANRRTNVKLEELLERHFGLALTDVYATNVFPFVKPAAMGSSLPQRDLNRAAVQFGLPQIKIVRPVVAVRRWSDVQRGQCRGWSVGRAHRCRGGGESLPARGHRGLVPGASQRPGDQQPQQGRTKSGGHGLGPDGPGVPAASQHTRVTRSQRYVGSTSSLVRSVADPTSRGRAPATRVGVGRSTRRVEGRLGVRVL